MDEWHPILRCVCVCRKQEGGREGEDEFKPANVEKQGMLELSHLLPVIEDAIRTRESRPILRLINVEDEHLPPLVRSARRRLPRSDLDEARNGEHSLPVA